MRRVPPRAVRAPESHFITPKKANFGQLWVAFTPLTKQIGRVGTQYCTQAHGMCRARAARKKYVNKLIFILLFATPNASLPHRFEYSNKAMAVKLASHVHAWNVDGSSSDSPPDGTSWIKHWETQTGAVRSMCAYRGCKRKASHGGHVWIKMKGPHIAPICAPCNSTLNAYRMQHEKGHHSYLSAGTMVVPTRCV